ncbi:response regulator [Sphingomonas sp. LHG3406-1]|uniref:response regulator n=1 Tax=Sphingomonas sp. LHG3406-1 TaxID=2804617 RepID=UPI0026221D75|nr:response regulator [Sphingomonas sp. LHG3406-1]
MRVLIVEDETMVAMAIEDALLDAGCEIVGIAGTVPEALGLIDRERPDAVTLDGNLNGTLTGPVARQLRELAIRHLVVTGYVELAATDPWLSQSPVIHKPFTHQALTKAAAEHFC